MELQIKKSTAETSYKCNQSVRVSWWNYGLIQLEKEKNLEC